MSFKIVTGGTTGAADGTLVSSSNKIVFTGIDVVVDCHCRVDDDTYTDTEKFNLPSDGSVQISFDGGSTWKAFADNPISLVTGVGTGSTDIGDLNFPIKLRQHATTASTSGSFTSDATAFTNCTALTPDPIASFTATAGNASVALSWSAVSNRTRYKIDRATNSGFTTGVALDISPSQTTTSFTDTGLTNGTTYYYRIKAVGTYRFSDTPTYATANAMPTSLQARWLHLEILSGTGPTGSLMNIAELEVAATTSSTTDILPDGATNTSKYTAASTYPAGNDTVAPWRVAESTHAQRWCTDVGSDYATTQASWLKIDLGSAQDIGRWRILRYGQSPAQGYNVGNPLTFNLWRSTDASPAASTPTTASHSGWTLADSGTIDWTTTNGLSGSSAWIPWRNLS